MFCITALAIPIALALSSPGFYRYVYFISIGYGLSVAGITIAGLAAYGPHSSIAAIAHGVLLAVYGLRLFGYLLAREFQTSFSSEKGEIEKSNAQIGIWKKLAIWGGVAVLYAIMSAPALFHLHVSAAGENVDGLVSWIGLAIGAAGLLTESIADIQKSAYKKKSPKDFASKGLYRMCRYPNYFGEMLVWLGSWIAGIASYGTDPFAWIISSIGLVCIWLVMFGSGKRLEEKQDKRYGEREDYQEYKKRVPALTPFMGPKSLKNVKIYMG